MFVIFPAAILLRALASICYVPQAESFYVNDPKSERAAAEWVAIAPREVVPILEPLAKHRASSGMKSAAIVSIESLRESYKTESTLEAVKKFSIDIKKGRFLLLVGDGETLPPMVERPGKGSPLAATDTYFVCDDEDHIPDRAIGRIPTKNPELLKNVIERTIAYEKDTKPAAWRRRVTFLAASGGFGAVIDSALDATVSAFLDRDLPLEYELRVMQPDAKSTYGIGDENAKTAILNFWNAGALVTIFAGHGSKHAFHTDVGMGIRPPICNTLDLFNLEVRSGAPFFLIFACDTGQFINTGRRANSAAPNATIASNGEGPAGQPAPSCFAEALLTQPKGAIGVYAATENSHPYPDLLIAHEMNELFRSKETLTIGELVLKAKQRVGSGGGEFRSRVDRMAGLFGLSDAERARLCEFELAIFTLFGDPAVPLRRPELPAEVSANVTSGGTVTSGGVIAFSVAAAVPDGSDVIVTCELTRAAAPRKKGYANANDRVLERVIGKITNGLFAGELAIPRTASKSGMRRFVIVADVRGEKLQAAGATIVEVQN